MTKMSRFWSRLVTLLSLAAYLLSDTHVSLALSVPAFNRTRAAGAESTTAQKPSTEYSSSTSAARKSSRSGCCHCAKKKTVTERSKEKNPVGPLAPAHRHDSPCPCCPSDPVNHSCPCPDGCALGS